MTYKTSLVTWLSGLMSASVTIKLKMARMSLSVMALCVISARSRPCKSTFGVSYLSQPSIFKKIFCAGPVTFQSPPWFRLGTSFWWQSPLWYTFPAFRRAMACWVSLLLACFLWSLWRTYPPILETSSFFFVERSDMVSLFWLFSLLYRECD